MRNDRWTKCFTTNRKIIFSILNNNLFIFLLQDADLGPAVRALIDAVIRTFPLPRYTPVTRQEKIQTIISDHLPHSVYDAIYNRNK